MEQSYNLRSPAVKRLMKEAREMREATSEYSAKPLDDNLFEWHFTFRGPADSDFDGGYYHGRIILPPEYPMKPPSILLLTPNGRFELNKKICLSISGYHPESWQPSWSIRTAILAIIGFMPTKGEGAIGALDYTPEERKKLAKQSMNASCPTCGAIKNLLASETSKSGVDDQKDKELAKQIMFAKPKASQSSTSEEKTNSEEQQTSTPDEGPRHRAQSTSNETQNSPAPTQQNVQPNPPRHIQQRNDSSSLMLIVVLAAAIALLLFRRLDRMFNLSDLGSL
uniref:Ubiquitin-conjugating enzyme E2 J1-like n=1 Tax=Phallusia mammillata TaxID=59560 RepID=A0A6F9DWP4_9ASCI|nr:ubiquitin-conjugating enzyme E2 J1-like [Phallusia mammillata]